MADKWHDNETTEPGRFGFASSSLRDALKAVAGLREPATQPAETMADTPIQQPAPMPEPHPKPNEDISGLRDTIHTLNSTAMEL